MELVRKAVIVQTMIMLAATCVYADPMRLWYKNPASDWVEALPIGNSSLGCMVFGGVGEERIQLNEKSMWSGSPQDADNPEAKAALPEIRKLLFEGKYAEAERLASEKLICKGPGSSWGKSAESPFGCYQTLGDLKLTFDHGDKYTDYVRDLDLSDAVASVSYQVDGVRFRREVFASAPAQAIVVRITADKPGKISFSAGLTRPERSTVTASGPDELVMSGRLNDGRGGDGITYMARLKAVAQNGSISTDGGTLRVARADSVTLLISAATDFKIVAPEQVARERLAKASSTPYEDLRAAHIADYRALFDRVTISLGPGSDDIPTDERIRACDKGAEDPGLGKSVV